MSAMLLQHLVTWLLSLILSLAPAPPPPVVPEPTEAAVVRIAYEQVGKRYVWAGKGPDVFDCSGLTSFVWREGAGIDFRAYTVSQWRNLPKVPLDSLIPGDLLFAKDLSHVYIYVGDGKVIHAPGTGLVVREDEFPSGRIRSEAVRPSLLGQ